jgi:hypothetical protein
MIDLEMYKTQWKTGTNEWQIGENLIEVPNNDPTHDPDHTSTVPYMAHATLTLKRPSARSYEATGGSEKGRVVVQFDGGVAKSLGFGGFIIWTATGQLHSA